MVYVKVGDISERKVLVAGKLVRLGASIDEVLKVAAARSHGCQAFPNKVCCRP
jgi:hypothetical protein